MPIGSEPDRTPRCRRHRRQPGDLHKPARRSDLGALRPAVMRGRRHKLGGRGPIRSDDLIKWTWTFPGQSLIRQTGEGHVTDELYGQGWSCHPYYFVCGKSRRKKRTAKDHGGECCAEVGNLAEKHPKMTESAIRVRYRFGCSRGSGGGGQYDDVDQHGVPISGSISFGSGSESTDDALLTTVRDADGVIVSATGTGKIHDSRSSFRSGGGGGSSATGMQTTTRRSLSTGGRSDRRPTRKALT